LIKSEKEGTFAIFGRFLISPTHYDFCGTKLSVNSHYTRSILKSCGTVTCNITYRICPNCKKHFHDEIAVFLDRKITAMSSMKNNCLSDTMVDAALIVDAVFTIPVE